MPRHADTQIADTPLRPQPVVLHLTTRQARCVYMMPGLLIQLARSGPVAWRGDFIKVIDE